MAKSVLELAVGTGQWDAGLKKAKSALDNFTQANGGLQSALNKDSKSMQTFIQMMGRMDSTAKTAKGQMNDYKGTIEQLTMQYNRLTDAQKQTIGQDYLHSIDQMKQKYQGVADEVAKINQSLKQTQEIGTVASSGGGLFGGDKLSGMLQVFGGNVMTKIAGAGLSFAGELKDMVAQGIELARQGEGIRLAFERLGRGDILQGLREATHGTVTDLELMKAAVKFNDFKLPLDELGTMLAFAQQKAKDTGQSVSYLVDSIVNGLGRKSKLILDNLGISATELDERMKDTGDMTKAVGDIIREQMSKAGDYIETAADRATKANVELENAMTRLGETFQPLSDSATSMWTDIKVGALDLLNSAIKPLIDKFTELGRMRAVYEGQSGDVRVNRQLDRLKGIQTDSYRQGTYKAQLRNYDTQIASHEQYLKDYKAWQSDKNNVGAYDRMQKFKQQTGLEWVSDVQAHLDAFKKMRSEYVQGAKTILEANPVPSPTTTTTTTTTTTGGNTFDASKIAFKGGEGFKADPNANFQSVWGMLGDEGLRKMMGIGAQQWDYGKVTDEAQGKGKKNDKKEEKKDDKVMDSMSKLTSGVSGIFSGIEQMGLEIPEGMKQVVSTLSGLMTVVQSVVTILEVIEALTSVQAAKPLAGGGIVPHAAGGYIIGGNSYSGDNIYAGGAWVNSGELVLNRAQQSTLASQLQGQDKQMHVVGEVQGEKIILVANRTFRRKGQGEIVTW